MPEFEEQNHSKKEAEAYSPRNENKPHSRKTVDLNDANTSYLSRN